MSFVFMPKDTALGVPILTRSTPYRVEFGVNDTSGGGGQVILSGNDVSISTPLQTVLAGVPFQSLALLNLFLTPATTPSQAAQIMKDVTIESIQAAGLANSLPLSYHWNAGVAGVNFPLLYLISPAVSGGAWRVTVTLRNSLIG